MKKLTLMLLAVLTLTFMACDDEDGFQLSIDDAGLNIKERSGTVDAVYADVKSAIENRDFTVVAEVDHSAAAAGVNLDLRPTRLIIFGNPAGGTQLMQADQRIGIDLPLKMLVHEDDEGNTDVAYFSGSTLTDRYDIENSTVEENINMALDAISGGDEQTEPRLTGDAFDDMIIKNSAVSVQETFDSLEAVLIANGLNIVAKVEHDVAAANAGLELRPTKLIIFGNPAVGTQLMQSNNRIGIDLPLKMLVWEDADGNTKLGYYDADFLTDRYDIRDREDVVDMVNMALSNLSEAALN